MSHELYKLHMMAYEIEVLNAHLLAGIITQAEYDEKMKQYECHHDVCVEEHDEEFAACYRDIINANINTLGHKE